MEFELLAVSFIAGILTILAPCMLPLLPILIGGSATESSKKKPIVIISSLMVSIIAFTLLLKVFSDSFGLSQSTLTNISGGILVLFGFFTLYPKAWDSISQKSKFNQVSNKALGSSAKHSGIIGDILIGASLGPVFTSCSPTFALIVATVLPTQLAVGTIYLIVYAVGLGIMMFAIAILGQKMVKHLGWATDPHGTFKKVLGVVFIAIGLAIIFGIDKDIEAYLIEQGLYDGISNLESSLRE